MLLFFNNSSLAQDTTLYNINIYNGLPSDHAYCILRDKYGYLWVGTEGGVIRYNGYTFKVFNESTGLPDHDVWDFFEDSKGRIWLSRISNEFGYILNGKYYKTYNKEDKTPYIYPRYIREVNGKIIFLSMYKNNIHLYSIENDTLYSKRVIKYAKEYNYFISEEGITYRYNNNNGALSILKTNNETNSFIEKCRFEASSKTLFFKNYIIVYPKSTSDSIIIINPDNCKKKVLAYDQNDNIYNHYESEGSGYILAHKQISTFNNITDPLQQTPYTNYLNSSQLKNNRISYLLKDSLWGTCIASTKKGIFIPFDIPSYDKEEITDISKYKYVGNNNNNYHYWWNNEYKLLAVLQPDLSMQYIKMNRWEQVQYITNYDANRILVFSNRSILLVNNRITSSYPLFKSGKFHKIDHPDSTYSELIHLSKSLSQQDLLGPIDGIIDNKGTIHCISRGIGYYTITKNGDTLISKIYSNERYKGIIYASIPQLYLMYGSNIISIGNKDSLVHLTANTLNSLGITHIKKILTDSLFGNIFIKTIDNLLLLNYKDSSTSTLFANYKLQQPHIVIKDSILIVASRSGILFSRIEGLGELSEPIFHPNIKSIFYKHLYDISATNDKVILNTDNGLLTVDIPTPALQNTDNSYKRYQLLFKSRNRKHIITNGDTLITLPSDNSIIFDVINPAGSGKLKIQTLIPELDISFNELRSEELQLQDITPGKYYELIIRASDDIWTSHSFKLKLYKIPIFWQTSRGALVLWGALTALTIAIILLTIYYTKKIVSAAHKKHHYLQTLELKAIHAQINPHFIFNSLNTGLYYISENKNKDAFEHISSFSELLRSYIKSARNSYISINEEIDNLENYIKLQQNRFENKFTYKIEISNAIDPKITIIPSLLLQPFIENAINHGLLHKETKGHLYIKFISENSEKGITCIIEDDGIGRESSYRINKQNPNKPTSYGSSLIADLVHIINTAGELNIRIEYIDKTGDISGTVVIITIRYLDHEKQL